MDGVTILNTVPVRSYPWVLIIIVLVINIIGFIIGCIKDNDGLKGISALFGTIMLILMCWSPLHVHPTRYEVSITNEVSFNEFAQHYKIIDQRGEIYVVEERTMKGNN